MRSRTSSILRLRERSSEGTRWIGHSPFLRRIAKRFSPSNASVPVHRIARVASERTAATQALPALLGQNAQGVLLGRPSGRARLCQVVCAGSPQYPIQHHPGEARRRSWHGCRIIRRLPTGVLLKGSIIITTGILLAIAASAFWAIGMTVAKPAVRHIDPVTFIIGRWSVVIIPLVVYGIVTQDLSFPGWAAIGWASLAGVIDATLGGLFYLMAMQRAPAYQTTTLSSTAPLFGMAAAFAFLGESFSWAILVSALLVVAGAFLMIGRRMTFGHTRWIGSLLAVLTGFLWGVAETVPAKLAMTAGLSPVFFLLVFAASGALGMTILSPFLRPAFPRRTSRSGWLLLSLSALCNAFIGWLLWLYALRLAPASLLAPIRGSTMLFAFIYAVVFLRERPTRQAIAGTVLVLGGVLLVSLP